MKNIKSISFVIIYTLLFTALIFTGKEIFYPTSAEEEESFVEPTLGDDFLELNDHWYYSFTWWESHISHEEIHGQIYESFKEKYTQAQRNKVSFRYVPSLLEKRIENSYLPILEVFFYERNILSHIENLRIFLYQNSWDTRWRMKSKKIHLFGVTRMSDAEFLSVMIHEFGHYFDIYSLERNSFGDESQKFYDISWSSVSVMKTGMKSEDFVSGYAMTNRYEDFAESYVYYILHNRDFLAKAQENVSLAKKYNFFEKYVFSQKQFYKQNFSLEENVEDYYWDITKLSVDVKKFLQYLQRNL